MTLLVDTNILVTATVGEPERGEVARHAPAALVVECLRLNVAQSHVRP